MRLSKRIRKFEDKIKEYKLKIISCPTKKEHDNYQCQITKLTNKIAKLKVRKENHTKVAMSNRENGDRFEFKLLRKEKRNGLLAMRSAGSHSLVDVLSIKKNGEIHLINAKSHGYHDPTELKKLNELNDLIKGKNFKLVIKLACYSSKKKYTCKTLK